MNTAHFQNIKEEIISIFNSSKSEIKIAMSWFTSFEIWEALIEIIQKNVKVSVITNNDEINNNSETFDFDVFISAGGKLYFIKEEYFLHDKFAIVDNQKVITGSYNYTTQAENINIENIVILEDELIIKDFDLEYSILLSNSIYVEKFVRKKRDYQVNNSFQKINRLNKYRVTYYNSAYNFIEIIDEDSKKFLLNCDEKFEVGDIIKLNEPFEFETKTKVKNNFLSVQKWIKNPIIIK